ncbi:ABC-type nitrate/sulfonate/bicarbonate transport system permease component [Microbacterium sp. AG790]|uniref:ABC transporter permease n=1 Tax=Microbacterium sp. AG790 TaxID=2183995 RepID=UPI000EB151B9|nr:ABC transporter permease subunit [Microbacterium sp. AG790]RKS86668.1 ABC-type nitrate/sulfonate/bicarbonate transport system permease component [Microbacterium sp. AG790]
MARVRVPGWVAGLVGAVVLVGVWWLFSLTAFRPADGTSYTPVPSPWAVVDWLFVQGNIAGAWGVFQPTITAAAIGYLWGNGIALLLATVVLVFPRTETVITQIAVVTYCLPIVAVGGISIVVLGGAKNPGDPSATAIFLAALVCVFTTVVGAILGFTSADKAALDVVRVYGGGRWTQLRKVRFVAALPAILTALQIAVPTAFLGAVLGEYLGAITAGVGPTLIRLQGQLDSAGVWSVFLLCAVFALVAYGLFGLLIRLVTPWVAGKAV